MSDKKECGGCETSSCSAQKQKPDEQLEEFLERQALTNQMCKIKNKILVLSGKGGVGKSTVSANLAVSLSLKGKQVGLLDVDIHGPSIPTLLGIKNPQIMKKGDKIIPLEASPNLKVMSIAFLLGNPDDPIIWRGPMKMSMIKQFLKDVEWGDLDYLIIDFPPGTGDEPLSTAQLISEDRKAIIVSTPQEVALADVRKSVNFCKQLDLPILGVVENMSGFVCPHCNEITNIFKNGGAEKMCNDMDIPFLGKLPIDPELVVTADAGDIFVHQNAETQITKPFHNIVEKIIENNNE